MQRLYSRRWMSIATLIVLLASLVFAGSRPLAVVRAAHTPQPASVTLAGNLQDNLVPASGCSEWNQACAATHLDQIGNGVWRKEFTVQAGDYEYKMAIDDKWDESYAGNHQANGNTTLTVPAEQAVRFYYDHKTHAVLDSVTDKIAVAAGSFQSELGCAGDWQPECVRSLLTDTDKDGIYTFQANTIPAGNYEFKVALDEGWATAYPSNNVPFSVGQAGQNVRITWNSTTNAVNVNVESGEPSPDNNVETDGLFHNSRSSMYRLPFGAVTQGTTVTLRFRTFHNDVTSVTLRLYNTATNGESFREMSRAASRVDCGPGGSTTGKLCDFWSSTLPTSAQGVIYYRFIVKDGTSTAYYEDDSRGDGGSGEPSVGSNDRSWNIYVYDAAFETPDWAKNAVIYQIFAERFRNGDPTNDPTADPATDRGWFYPQERGHRFPITPWNTIVPDPEPYSDNTRPYWSTYSSTMYGGDLQGVTEKLDYLKALGVTTVYLNPIFDSPSNHKYDGRDYRTVDPAFGGKAAFDALVAGLKARGMYLILDAVPNHVSSDSPFFDRFGRHDTLGACESVDSPYRNWFFFEPAAQPGTGVCAGDTNYRGWFGVATLPQINTANPEVLSYWFLNQPGGKAGLPTGTANYWLDQGADGWRVDVVPDIVGVNPTFFEKWRASTKAAHPNSISYSETWSEGDVRDRVLGDEFDSTMNYRYRRAVLGFLRDTRWTDNDGGQEIDPLTPSQFIDAMKAMEEDYPKPAWDVAMNLIDSHDTNRAVQVLNEKGFTGSGYTRQPVDGFADARERLGMVAALQMTLPGAPTIYYGDEVGLTGYGSDVNRDDPYNRQPYPWADQAGYDTLPDWRKAHTDLLAEYKALTGLRNGKSYLRTGTFDALSMNDADKLLVYGRKDATGAAIVVFNRNTTPQTVTVDLAGYVPNGMMLDKSLPAGAGNLPVNGSMYTFSVPAQSYGIWTTPVGTPMTPPAAPGNLRVTGEMSRSVALAWDAAPTADGYSIYRSAVSGGGYELVAQNVVSTTFTDQNLAIGQTYYYVVRATADGLASPDSNEVAAIPHLAISWANLQWPPQITQTISTITRTTEIYGQVYIAGITDGADTRTGATPTLRAQVGYGQDGSDPATSARWRWTEMVFNTDAGNNDEFKGTLLPDSPGRFDYAVRYTTTNGRDWVYADRDGIGNGYSPEQAGDLLVIASSDTAAPAAPTALQEASRSSSQISISWTAPADTDIAHYEIWRDGSLLTTVLSGTTQFTDLSVTTGMTYTYKVRAVDTSFNRSEFSAEVSSRAEQRNVQVTFRVRVPQETPERDIVYIAGNSNEAFGATWNPGATPMTEVSPNVWEYTTSIREGTALEYKYTRGSWDKVEWWGTIVGTANRRVAIRFEGTGQQLVDDTATNWNEAGSDDHKAVQYWRDPLVQSVNPTGNIANTPVQPISVTFSTVVTPTAALSDVLTIRTQAGIVVGGTVTRSGDRTFIFTPAQPLMNNIYTITVMNVRREIGDVSPMQAPYSWTIMVGNGIHVYLPIIRK